MSRRPKNIVVNAGNIEFMFSKAPTEPLKTEEKKTITATLKSDDPLVQEYYNQLKPAEIIAHTIAIEKLGTSYDVVRTHGFIRWSKARIASGSGSGGSGSSAGGK